MRMARVIAPLTYGRGVGGEGSPSSGPSDHLLPEGEGADTAVHGSLSLTDDRVERRLIGEGGGEQSARIVVLRSAEDRTGFPALHHLAAPHHDDFARQRPHDSQVVRNEKIGEVSTALQFAQEI